MVSNRSALARMGEPETYKLTPITVITIVMSKISQGLRRGIGLGFLLFFGSFKIGEVVAEDAAGDGEDAGCFEEEAGGEFAAKDIRQQCDQRSNDNGGCEEQC